MENSKRKSNVILLTIVLIIVIIAAYFGYQWLSGQVSLSNIAVVDPTPKVSQDPTDQSSTASDFVVMDANGNEVRLSDYKGTPVVLNFWASWCGPCQSEMPEFQSVYEMDDNAVVFMMVNITDGDRETLQSAKDFIRDEEYTFPVYFDTELSAVNAYGVSSIPTTYFINAQGSIVAVARGPIEADTLMEAIGMITE